MLESADKLRPDIKKFDILKSDTKDIKIKPIE